ncbi:MAG: hypothetical protein ACRC3A_00955 [Culicoidibacterales bacterium]
MSNFFISFKILLKATRTPRHVHDSFTIQLYYASLRTLGVLASFGFGILFALRFFGPSAFSSYYLLSWLLFFAVIPKAFADDLRTPSWLMYVSLPISQTTWKWAQLLHFSVMYGYSLFLPLIFGLIWTLLYQQVTIFFAFLGIWLLVCSFVLFICLHRSKKPVKKSTTLFLTSCFWLFVIFNFVTSLQPSTWQFFYWLQVWLTPNFGFSQLFIFVGGFLIFFTCIHNWQLVRIQSSLNVSTQSLFTPWHWLLQTLRTTGFLSQWFMNLWFILLAILFLIWQAFPDLSVILQISFVTITGFCVFALFSPAWCLYSLIAPELLALRALPFDWCKDYWQRWLLITGLQASQVILFSLALTFVMTPISAVISACFILILLLGQTLQALSFDLLQPQTNWHSVIQLLRPTWPRLLKIALTALLLIVSLVLNHSIQFLGCSIIILTIIQSYLAIQRRKKFLNQ